MSLIPPSSLNLFLPTNLVKGMQSKDLYGPPTQAYNASKKIF